MPEEHNSETLRPLLALAAASVLAIVSYATAATMMLESPVTPATGSRQLPQAGALPGTPPPASPPVSVQPAPSTDPVAAQSLRPQRPRVITTGAKASATKSPSASPSPTPVTLVVGSTVALAVPALPDHLLRHYNFVARVDLITAASKPLDRLDAQFQVRAGRADSSCVSLESVNYPGHFLRHRDSLLRLDRAGAPGSFDQDATFCTVATAGGFALRSSTFPAYHLVLNGGWVRFEQRTAEQATVFRAVPPL
ncbi:AbfB domain-containing protein [Actinoplanes sp. NEAU-A12]|uniref:AbfB domain-containing protein n=1 Tax=Actinoplanes sandaracinus TaxID=3045177 RepID=A0ABT6WII2_9ACTN|nr:AbfB domain-containing protein [Actinoplanes sandaracinus]MDI6099534.1 AbfB domain-containing protein [Actinoplanes sandaracinus]